MKRARECDERLKLNNKRKSERGGGGMQPPKDGFSGAVVLIRFKGVVCEEFNARGIERIGTRKLERCVTVILSAAKNLCHDRGDAFG